MVVYTKLIALRRCGTNTMCTTHAFHINMLTETEKVITPFVKMTIK